ncbi:MAG: MFS transporter [Legionella sp.]|nr:MFS transporter [Legionella sp.]
MKRRALYLVLSLIFLEWLDFTLYLYLAKSVFAPQFFPPSSDSLTLTFSLFTAAYFARPVGGWLFGRYADKRGRRTPMVYSSALMGIATIGICLLPGYIKIGAWAGIGLLLLRIFQGIALGGEINTSAMFLVEHHPQKPLIAGSYVAASGALGMFTGGALATLLQYIPIAGAWRLVFAVVGLLSLWVCRLRKQLRESPEFDESQTQAGIKWRHHWRGLLNIAVAGVFVSVSVYMCNVLWVSYAIDKQIWSKTGCAWLGACAQLASALLALLIARFAKPRQVYLLMHSSMAVIALSTPLLFYSTSIGNAPGTLLALAGYVLANGLICSALFYFLYLQLPTMHRCQGVSTVWALAASIGTISLPLSESAIARDLLWFPGVLVSTLALFSFLLCRDLSLYTKSFLSAAPKCS